MFNIQLKNKYHGQTFAVRVTFFQIT